VTPPAPADRPQQNQRRDRSPEQRQYNEKTRAKEFSPPSERGSNSRIERGRQGDAHRPEVTERNIGIASRSSQQQGSGSYRENVSLIVPWYK
jgi:hypothetical protein